MRSGIHNLLYNDVETKCLLVGYGFAAIVAKSIYQTYVLSLSEMSRVSPVEIFESFLVSKLSEDTIKELLSISIPYNIIQQALARLLDPIWEYPLFTLNGSLTLSQALLERFSSILRQFLRFYESHFDLKSSEQDSLNPQIWNDYLLLCRLQDISQLCLHVAFHSVL